MHGKVELPCGGGLILEGQLVAAQGNAVSAALFEAVDTADGKDTATAADGDDVFGIRVGQIFCHNQCSNRFRDHARIRCHHTNGEAGGNVLSAGEMHFVQGVQGCLLQPGSIQGHVFANGIGACHRLLQLSIIAPAKENMLRPVRGSQGADKGAVLYSGICHGRAVAGLELDDGAFLAGNQFDPIAADNVAAQIMYILGIDETIAIHICSQGVDGNVRFSDDIPAHQDHIEGIYAAVLVDIAGYEYRFIGNGFPFGGKRVCRQPLQQGRDGQRQRNEPSEPIMFYSGHRITSRLRDGNRAFLQNHGRSVVVFVKNRTVFVRQSYIKGTDGIEILHRQGNGEQYAITSVCLC